MAVTALLEVGDRLRRGETSPDDVIVLAEGGELEAKAIRPVLAQFARIRRLERKIVRLEESLLTRRRSRIGRKTATTAVAVARESIQKVVAEMPLKPALIDELVAQVRRRWSVSASPTERVAAAALRPPPPKAARSHRRAG